MKIISHRGYWKRAEEKNTRLAFERSLTNGFGIETDFRDLNGELVISHDPATNGVMLAKDFFRLEEWGEGKILAVNVKADGLQGMLLAALSEAKLTDYFLFDMSAPDALVSHRRRLRFFTRESEIEPVPYLYPESAGVWMDMFYSDWVTASSMMKHLNQGKSVCLVSPELHGREHLCFWERLKGFRLEDVDGSRVMLCTDFPDRAERYFNE